MKRSWEIITDNPSKAGWTWGYVATLNRDGRTIFVADARRGDGKRFVVRADEKLAAFVELDSAIRGFDDFALTSRRDFLQTSVTKRI